MKRSDFFKNHWLGIFLSSTLAGIVSMFIYDHWPSHALSALSPGNASSSVSESTSPGHITPQQNPVHQIYAPDSISPPSPSSEAPISHGWEDLELVPVDASGRYVKYIPRLPLRNTCKALSAPDLIAGLESAGFRGAVGQSQWPQWRATADVANAFELLRSAGPRIVEDKAIGLDWYVADYKDELTWDQSLMLVRRLNGERPLGLTGWRLPTTEELATILEPEKRSSIHNRYTGGEDGSFCVERILQPTPIPRNNGFGRYWSCDEKSEDWMWTLETGSGCGFHKWGRNYGAGVLAVRSK